MKLNLESNELFQTHRFPQWKHGEAIIQLGSCFSTNMTTWFRKAGFSVVDNPFGVIFHPLVLADHLQLALGEKEVKPVFQRNDIWLSYDAGSKIYAMSELELQNKIQEQIAYLRSSLNDSKHLILTFGTAHGYELKSSGELVANCHQQAATNFSKRLFTAFEMFEVWELLIAKLTEEFPELSITFTISPVRYIRDGIIENNQSKAVLIELVRQLQERFPNLFYLPVYELVVDVLRDYRFYDRDLVHPNELAVEAVWEFCHAFCFSDETKSIIRELFELRQMEAHQLMFPESEKSAEFLEKMHKKRERFLSQFVAVVW